MKPKKSSGMNFLRYSAGNVGVIWPAIASWPACEVFCSFPFVPAQQQLINSGPLCLKMWDGDDESHFSFHLSS